MGTHREVGRQREGVVASKQRIYDGVVGIGREQVAGKEGNRKRISRVERGELLERGL